MRTSTIIRIPRPYANKISEMLSIIKFTPRMNDTAFFNTGDGWLRIFLNEETGPTWESVKALLLDNDVPFHGYSVVAYSQNPNERSTCFASYSGEWHEVWCDPEGTPVVQFLLSSGEWQDELDRAIKYSIAVKAIEEEARK